MEHHIYMTKLTNIHRKPKLQGGHDKRGDKIGFSATGKIFFKLHPLDGCKASPSLKFDYGAKMHIQENLAKIQIERKY